MSDRDPWHKPVEPGVYSATLHMSHDSDVDSINKLGQRPQL